MQSETSVQLPPFGKTELTAIVSVLILAIVALLFGLFLRAKVLREPEGTEKMRQVAEGIREGANAYLRRQFKSMLIFIIILAIGLFALFYPIYTKQFPEIGLQLALGVPIAFLMGVFASYGAGYVGMKLAVEANQRVAYAALSSFRKALKIAFDAGGVSGLFTIGLGLLGATIIFLIYREHAMQVLVGFGFGGSLAALFMRMGGGIYTKAADVGADLVGKVEAGIPEDDPRNAAVIADNVGDNVGDCAGMAADVFESYEVTLVAAIILGAVALNDPKFNGLFPDKTAAEAFALKLIILPLLIRAVGVIASIIGIYSVNPREDEEDPMKPINFGFGISSLVALIGIGLVTWWFLGGQVPPELKWWKFFLGSLLGVLLAYATLGLTDYYTHVDRPPVTETSYSSKTGVATLILTGLAHGFQSSVWALILIVGALSGAIFIFWGIPSMQMYSVALTGLGLLTTVGYVLAMDTYGPITDNANGIFEMSGVLKETGNERAQWIVAKLDAVGNTTKALTKGLAIATAVIAATALFSSYTGEANLTAEGIRINLPVVFIGLLIGGSIPFLFSSFAINAVSRAAFLVVEEVRRQFREIPGLMEGKAKPDYSRVVDITTSAAQKELLGPGALAVFSTVLTGFVFGAEALGAFLGGAILTGQLMAVFMANAGAIWDNAKKKIEEGFLGGKGTEYHKAGVVGDTVGDPLKDTAGPAINPLIKVINLISILIAPVIVASSRGQLPIWIRLLIILVSLLALAWAVYWANRGSLLETEEAKQALREFQQAKHS